MKLFAKVVAQPSQEQQLLERLFPLTELGPSKAPDSLIIVWRNFFSLIIYKTNRDALHTALQLELGKPEWVPIVPALSSRLPEIASELFSASKGTFVSKELATIIPDTVLLQLSRFNLTVTPPSTIEGLAKQCLIYVTAACRARDVQVSQNILSKKYNKAQLDKILFLIECDVPGLLSKIKKINEQKADEIVALIASLKAKSMSALQMEAAILEAMSVEKPQAMPTRTALSPTTIFIQQHPDFVSHFQQLARLEWPAERLDHLYKISEELFARLNKQWPALLLELKKIKLSDKEERYIKQISKLNRLPSLDACIPDAVLLIAEQFDLMQVMRLDGKSEIAAGQCKLLIQIGCYLEEHIKIKSNAQHDDAWKARKKLYESTYFLKILKEPKLLNNGRDWTDIDALMQYLEIDTPVAQSDKLEKEQGESLQFSHLHFMFPHLMRNITGVEEIHNLTSIRNLLFHSISGKDEVTVLKQKIKTDENSKGWQALLPYIEAARVKFLPKHVESGSQFPEYFFDLVMAIISRFDLVPIIKESKNTTDIIPQCLEIIEAAQRVDELLVGQKVAPQKHEQYKPLMMQLELRFEGSLSLLEIISSGAIQDEKNFNAGIKDLHHLLSNFFILSSPSYYENKLIDIFKYGTMRDDWVRLISEFLTAFINEKIGSDPSSYMFCAILIMFKKYNLDKIFSPPRTEEEAVALFITILETYKTIKKYITPFPEKPFYSIASSTVDIEDVKRRLWIHLLSGEQSQRLMPEIPTYEALLEMIEPDQAPRERIASLIDSSLISKQQEETVLALFSCFPFVKNLVKSYSDAEMSADVSNALFPFINASENKSNFISSHLVLSEAQKSQLLKRFNGSPLAPLPNAAILDLIILLVLRYGAADLFKNTLVEQPEDSARACLKVLATVAEVDEYLSSDFVSYTNVSEQLMQAVSTESKAAALANSRQQAFALAYETPGTLNNIARNTSALSTKYESAMRERKRIDTSHYHEFTVSDLTALRGLNNNIIPDDSASNQGDDQDSTLTRTTVLAGMALQRAKIIRQHKELMYHKTLVHAKKGKNAADARAIDQLTQDIQSHLTMIFTGILSVASRFVERSDTTHADTALEVFCVIRAAIPEPITRLVSAGLIAAGQFFLDYKELQRFLKMAKNLNTFGDMDIINQELTGLVVEYFADEFIELLNAEPDREAAYRTLSGKITALLEAKVLLQLKNKDIESEPIHLGVALFEGLQADGPKLGGVQSVLSYK